MLSAIVSVSELTVVVAPSTCKLPLITTVVSSSASPIFTVSPELKDAKTVANFVLSTLSTSVLPAKAVVPDVPICNKAVLPTNAVVPDVPKPGNET